MPAALDQNYDGIISRRRTSRHDPWHLLRKAGLNILLVERRLQYGGGLRPKGDRARLLSQPAFDQSFPHHRHPVVQRPQSRRTCRLRHAALRIRSAASATAGADLRPRLEETLRQYRALLHEGRADVPRLEPARPRK